MMDQKLRLGINIDHVCTVRNARGGTAPDPLRAAELAIQAGADGITAHLREDRRHVRDADIWALKPLLDGLNKPLNFEMAVTDEMIAIALELKPHAACLVPERREERTTEGGLDVAGNVALVGKAVERFNAAGIRSSLFIATDPVQIAAASSMSAPVVEFHTGALCDAWREGEMKLFQDEVKKLEWATLMARDVGIEVHAGHGIDYDTVGVISRIAGVRELNIGHFLIGEAIFVGLEAAIKRMSSLMDAARGIVPA
jgi:pyridoxine 5-phosphate synthase